MKTVQMFFEDCVASSLSATYLNQTFNVSESFFLFLPSFGQVVSLCKKGKITTCIECKKLS